jgi:hypothetical protein
LHCYVETCTVANWIPICKTHEVIWKIRDSPRCKSVRSPPDIVFSNDNELEEISDLVFILWNTWCGNYVVQIFYKTCFLHFNELKQIEGKRTRRFLQTETRLKYQKKKSIFLSALNKFAHWHQFHSCKFNGTYFEVRSSDLLSSCVVY